MISRRPENGGDVEFAEYGALEAAFANAEVHPGDLKAGAEVRLNALLEPVRRIFETPELVPVDVPTTH